MTSGKENKIHIGIYGKRNVGKSSFINYITGQNISIVSQEKGTTTDPVKRSYEILDFAPVIFIDTAGIDDEGTLGKMRIDKTYNTISNIDIAIIIISDNNFDEKEENIIEQCKNLSIPFLIINNKSDICKISENLKSKITEKYKCPIIDFSTNSNYDKKIIFKTIKNIIPENSWKSESLLGDIITKNDLILLIMPIDTEAPAGRIILPQVQTIRDILDNSCICIALKESELPYFLENNTMKIKLAVTDSQMFGKVEKIIPEEIPLTGFSILLAKHKGDFENYLLGTPAISKLKDGSNILILESCSHHTSCEDIGRYKIPKLLEKFTNKKLNFTFVSGLSEIPGNITDYNLVVQCGGCMITKKQILNRLKPFTDNNIPITNYGMLIAYTQGIFETATKMFKK